MQAMELTQELLLLSDMMRCQCCHEKVNELSVNELTAINAIIEYNQANHSGIKMTQLSDIMHASKSAMSQLISRLEKKGIVKRYLNKQDRRVIYVKMTDSGNALFESQRNRILLFFEDFLSRMGNQDVETLSYLLKKSIVVIREINNDQKVEGIKQC